MAEYKARNHSWPPRPEEYKPSAPGWRTFKERRFRQIEAMPWTEWKYCGWVSAVHTALTCPNFTEHGWTVTRAPEHVLDMLTRSLHSGLDSGSLPEEHPFTIGLHSEFGQQPQLAIQPPLVVRQKELSDRLLDELKPMLEVWSGTKLRGRVRIWPPCLPEQLLPGHAHRSVGEPYLVQHPPHRPRGRGLAVGHRGFPGDHARALLVTR